MGYIQTLHKAHIQYCKEQGIKATTYSGFYKRWELVRGDDKLITVGRQEDGRRVTGRCKKDDRKHHIKTTGDNIAYSVYLYRLEHGNKPKKNYDFERLLHSIINGKYAISYTGIPKRLINAKSKGRDVAHMIFIPNMINYRGIKFLHREMKSKKLDIDRYKYLYTIGRVKINLLLKNKNNKVLLEELKEIGKEVQKDFYSKINL